MTTIITKHGTGVPSSLQVGELAIDKAEPAIYTNTGSGVEKIATASSGGGGGGGGGDLPAIVGWGPRCISFGGTHGSKLADFYTGSPYLSYISSRVAHTVKTGFTWSNGQTITYQCNAGYRFKFIMTNTSTAGMSVVLKGCDAAPSGESFEWTLHNFQGSGEDYTAKLFFNTGFSDQDMYISWPSGGGYFSTRVDPGFGPMSFLPSSFTDANGSSVGSYGTCDMMTIKYVGAGSFSVAGTSSTFTFSRIAVEAV